MSDGQDLATQLDTVIRRLENTNDATVGKLTEWETQLLSVKNRIIALEADLGGARTDNVALQFQIRRIRWGLVGLWFIAITGGAWWLGQHWVNPMFMALGVSQIVILILLVREFTR